MTRIARASLIVAFFFGIDKIMGLARQMLFTRAFGPIERDIFFVSNNIPDLLSALISGGALGIALIPVLTEHLQREDREGAWALFSRILNLAFLATGGLALVIIAFARPLIQHVIAPGFNDPQQWDLAARLMRLDLFAILIFSISGLAMAGLHANQHFIAPALAPTLYNLGQIAGILLLAPRFGIFGMVYGVILGSLLHLGIQIPALLHYGFRWRPLLSLRDPAVLQVLRLMGPRVLSMLSLHIYFLARDRFASFYQPGGVSALNNGWFVMQLPETLVGTAIGIALLPSLAEYATRGENERYTQTINHALRAMLAVLLPAAAVLWAGARPLVEMLFRLQPAEAELTVWATRVFLAGLVGHAWLEVGVRAWYARQQARVPLLGAFFQIGLYLPLAWLLSSAIGHVGIILADTLAFTSQAVLLLALLWRRAPGLLDVGGTLLRAAPGALLGGLVVYGLLWMALPLPAWLGLGLALGAGALTALPFMWPELKLLLKL